jgi:hypothetical protein
MRGAATRNDGAMSERASKLAAFMAEYDRAANRTDYGLAPPRLRRAVSAAHHRLGLPEEAGRLAG